MVFTNNVAGHLLMFVFVVYLIVELIIQIRRLRNRDD